MMQDTKIKLWTIGFFVFMAIVIIVNVYLVLKGYENPI